MKTTSVARQGQTAREAFFRGVEPEARRNTLAIRRDVEYCGAGMKVCPMGKGSALLFLQSRRRLGLELAVLGLPLRVDRPVHDALELGERVGAPIEIEQRLSQ